VAPWRAQGEGKRGVKCSHEDPDQASRIQPIDVYIILLAALALAVSQSRKRQERKTKPLKNTRPREN
jgi:hypothetical protein